ncbi:hypothetical protein L198_07472 [Cryptococcus wingfieldii CBS 7118]|uniref:Uncharacterized protein n=1 Tax=Cryptococcus wingfieldii CBS 7118 TaxID=1295528 RepID=A0A1E3IBA8_9TREE|nr:hypothetical protein L198_07472 [Cryptococcus wingfieldii CBS 7118]ODN85903.1 hypothetical protein L198_07472 [Cryptococcus wingfieldii CBS 7118]
MGQGSGHLQDRVQWPINTRQSYLWMAKHGVSTRDDVMSLTFFCKKYKALRVAAGTDFAAEWAPKVAAWITKYNQHCRPWLTDPPSFSSSAVYSKASGFAHKNYPLECNLLWG